MRNVVLLTLSIGFAMSLASQLAFAQEGACCSGDGTCTDTNLGGCDLGSGDFLGEGTACATTVCMGACCLPEKACAEDTRDACDGLSGSFQGPETTCALHCAATLSTVFTYQGQLKQAGAPLNGTADLEFSLWNSTKGGEQVGATVSIDNVLVKGGLFSVPLDFGLNAFSGNARWLEIAVRSPHDVTDTELFSTLLPRQAVTATPQAMFSSAPWKTAGNDISYSAGNVGIGTDAPTSLLHVRGDDTQEVSIWGSTSVPLLHFRTTRNGDDWVFKHDGSKFHFQKEGGPGHEILTMQTDGRIGIGTTSPEADLHIYDGTAPTIKLQSNGTSEESGRLSLRQSNNSGVDMYYDGTSVEGLVFETYNSGASEGKPLYISNKNNGTRGYVGIGTTSPSASLDVAGQIRSSGADGGRVVVFNPNNQLASAQLSWADNVARIRVGGNGSGAEGGFDIQTTSNNSLLRLLHNGNVGIGTSNPQYKLHVTGNTPRTIFAHNSATLGTTVGIWSECTGTVGRGVFGYASASTGNAIGVMGESESSTGRGVYGRARHLSGNAYGVLGESWSTSGYGVFSNGDFGGTGAKYFVQPHPRDASKEIRFVSLEGNESGTYFRGSSRLMDGRVVIDVPEEFSLVSEIDGLTVQVTAMGPNAGLWIESKNLDQIVVRGNGAVEFDYFVNGVRRGFANHRAIRENHAYVPQVRGVPYGTQFREDHRRILVENGTLNADFTPNEQNARAMGWKLREPTEEEATLYEAIRTADNGGAQ